MPKANPVKPPRKVVVRRRIGKEVERRGSRSRVEGGSRLAARSDGREGKFDAMLSKEFYKAQSNLQRTT